MEIPTAGWAANGVKDTLRSRRPQQSCDRCKQLLRFSHSLIHFNWPETIHVGGVCAKRLVDGNYDADGEERKLRNLHNRRRRFPHRTAWFRSGSGKWFLLFDGGENQLILTKNRLGWSWSFGDISSRSFPTRQRAARNAFDYLEL